MLYGTALVCAMDKIDVDLKAGRQAACCVYFSFSFRLKVFLQLSIYDWVLLVSRLISCCLQGGQSFHFVFFFPTAYESSEVRNGNKRIMIGIDWRE